MIHAYPSERSSSVESIEKKLGTSRDGLSSAEAKHRLSRFGLNQFRKERKKSLLSLLFHQLTSTVMLVLIAAAIVSAFLGNTKDAIGIAVAVLLSSSIGFIMEYRSDNAIAHLSKLTRNMVRVKRDGETVVIDSTHLVVGDRIVLEEGAHIPADARIVSSSNAMANESTLTGESLPVEKGAESSSDCIVYAGTLLSTGTLEAYVIATGMNTQVGSIAAIVSQDSHDLTPLQKNMNEVGRVMSIFVIVAAILFFAFGIIVRQGDLTDVLTSSVVLAVAGVSEGLPTVIGLTLALGMLKMAKKHAIARRLSVVEDLGAVTVVCTDKTGTLTMNAMRPLSAFTESNSISFHDGKMDGEVSPDIARLLSSAVIANAATLGKNGEPIGDPTETGLLLTAVHAGIDVKALKTREILHHAPFDSTRKMMSMLCKDSRGWVLHAKGAPESILEHCTGIAEGSRVVSLSPSLKEEMTSRIKSYASKGARIIAVASRPSRGMGDVSEEGFTFLGCVALYDPPRAEAKNAIQKCIRAGIRVYMITGDSKETAENIAVETGFPISLSMSGADYSSLSSRHKMNTLESHRVFYRVSPIHKHEIVSMLKSLGHVVAVTGDGVNDAPAMKKADIGVCMGRSGSDVTKDAAGLVLMDDNFATIVNAIEYGRSLFTNIVNFIRFQFTTTAGLLGTVFASVLIGLNEPFVAVQVLFINVIMDGPPALALGVEPSTRDVMARPPRNPKEPYVNRRLLSLVGFGGAVMVISMLALLWFLHDAGLPEARIGTIAFVTMVVMQLFHAFNCKSDTISLRKNAFSNKWLVLSALTSFALLMLVVYLQPLSEIMGTVPLTMKELAFCIAFSFIVVVADEARKFLEARQSGRPLEAKA